MIVINLLGEKFGRLIVNSRAENSPQGQARWNCVCECSGTKVVKGHELRSGKVSSCGCLHIESITRHGKSRTPEYKAWIHMRERCTKPSCKHFHHYGGRGISVCEEWSSFDNFISDMGSRPSNKHSLDRIDNNKGYSKENCRWALSIDQMNNTRRNKKVFFEGSEYSINQLSAKTGIHRNTLDNRIFAQGLSVESAVYGAQR
jgi:hypothetical protein